MAAPYAVSALVDDLLQYGEGANRSVARYRARVLNEVQRASDYTWTYRNWAFRYGSATVAADATTGVISNTPGDFLTVGPSGGLTVSGQRRPLVWMPPRDYSRALNANAIPPGIPRWFTELDVVAYGRHLAVYPVPTPGFETLLLTYDRTSPTLTDDDPGGLEVVPVQWHRTVIYNGSVYYLMKNKGNNQSRTEQWDLFKQGLNQMAAEERGGRSEQHNLPAYGMGRGRFR